MSRYAPLDVVLAAIPVGESQDPRRCVVLEADGSKYLVLPCSSQLDLITPDDFLVSSDHPNFGTAGFKHTSYVINAPVVEINESEIRKKYGHFDGALAVEFFRWLE